MRNWLGWIASFCFCFSGLPAAIESYQTKVCTIPTGTLVLWTVGEICAIIYIIPKKDYPLLVNYSINIIFVSIMWYFK